MMAPVFSRAAWRCAWYMVQVYNLCSIYYFYGINVIDQNMLNVSFFRMLSIEVSFR